MAEQPGGWSAPGQGQGQGQGQGRPETEQEQAGWSTPSSWNSPAAPAQPWQDGPAGHAAFGYGAPQPGVIPLRPLGLGELLDGGITLVRRYPRPTLGLAAGVSAVSTILSVLVLLSGRFPSVSGAGGAARALSARSSFGSTFTGVGRVLTGLVTGLAGLVLAGVIAAVVGQAVLGLPLGLREAWARVRGRVGALLGLVLVTALLLAVIVGLGVGVAAAAIAVGGGLGAVIGVPVALAATALAVYLYVGFSLAPTVLVLERAGIRESLRRSRVLVRRSWWRLFGILLLTAVITATVAAVVQLPLAAIGALISFTGGRSVLALLVATQIGAGLAQVLVAPFAAGIRGLLYVDQRMRKEGLDLTLQARAAGGGAAATPS